MSKQENTAINDLIGLVTRKPIAEGDEPALFSASPPTARLRPSPFGGALAPIGATVAPLPRRRAPAATPAQVPIEYPDEDAATTVHAPAGWGAPRPVAAHADTGPYAPPSLPEPPYVAPRAGYAYPHQYPQHAAAPALPRPAYPPPHQPPAYYQAPYADHLETMRVRALPLEADVSPARALAREVLETMVRLWIPFAALGVIAVALAGYRLLRDDRTPEEPTAPIVMAAAPAEAEPPVPGPEPAAVAAEPAAVAAEPAAVAAEPAAVDHGVPKDSLWQPTKPQPTIAPPVETAAIADVAAEPEIEVAPAAAAKPAARASTDRSSSRRAAKRAAAKRAKQVALAELPADKPVKAVPRETKVVAIAPAKPMKIGATTVAAAKGSGGAGKLTVASTPATLIYVDGRNTGMMTPKTLSLPEGNHKITLLSPKDRIAKTISVEIEAGTSAQLAKNFTK